MALRLLTVCFLIGTVYSQGSGEVSTTEQILNATRPLSESEALMATQAGYSNTSAVNARRRHFFCVERNTFPMTDGVLVQFDTFEQISDNVFSIWFQYPLLAYLDVHRKNVLMEAIVAVLNTPVPDDQMTVNIDNLCLGTYDTYGLTTFNEGVMIHIYGVTIINGTEMAERFQDNLGILHRNAGNLLVTNYPRQSGVISFNLANVSTFDSAMALHPGAQSSDEVDPTLWPVIIGVFAGNVSIKAVPAVQANGVSRNPFASNPNPINYYLQVGDYIFAVIGAILLAVVLFLIIFGYCIHPFM